MCWALCKLKKLKIELTGNVPVAIFQSVEIQHELPDGDLENFKQTHVLKERVRHLCRQKQSKFQNNVLSSALAEPAQLQEQHW